MLEHIEHDSAEINALLEHLKTNGKLVILSPAHNYLYSPFDKNIGHFRRYNKKMLREIMPKALQEEQLEYLDAVGFFASLANKLLLNASLPSIKQILFWDKVLVRASRWIDPLLLNLWGKSIFGVWRKAE